MSVARCSWASGASSSKQTETAGESSLSYDLTTGQYTYVWKTDKAWSGQSRKLVLRLDDGSEHEANFAFN